MQDTDILEMLKADLEKLTVPKATEMYLTQLVSVAKAEIQREGITLKEDNSSTTAEKSYTAEDGQLIEMYAAYLYRKRAESDNGMPRMLRYRLNNRLFSEKGKVTEGE